MTEQNAPALVPEENSTPQMTPSPEAPKPAGPAKKPIKKRKKGRWKGLLALVLILAVLGGGGWALWKFVLSPAPVDQGDIYSQTAYIGSIQSTVQGSGNAKAKESATITLTEGGEVREVFVSAGEAVTAGQPLYTIYSEAAEKAVTTARDKVDSLNKDLRKLQEQVADLVVKAPFSGKLTNVKEFTSDEDVSSGTEICTLVNDTKLKLSLYFSYAYDGKISVGQAVNVSIPAVMKDFTGKVEKINKVSYISPEGAVHFEVVVVFDNPGTLTAGMDASASVSLADGSTAYPYASAKTEYYETRTITTKASGPLVSSSLLNYANVTAGTPLVTLGSDSLNDDIQAKQEEIADAQSALADAQKALANFNAVSPIDGTVTSCNLVEGQEVKSGDTVIMISNTSTMLVTIDVDDRNISFIKPGDMVDLTDYNDNLFTGTVTSIDMSKAESSNGMTNYPVILTVDNMDGSLIEGSYLQYSFVTSQSDDCVLIPGSAVKSVMDTDGNAQTVVFVHADARPENAIDLDLPEVQEGERRTYPTEAEGYWPVPVEIGISDTNNVEIKSGVEDGQEVFVNYTVTDSSYN